MFSKRLFFVLVGMVMVLLAVMPVTAQADQVFPTADWLISSPEAQGMDSAELAALFARFSQPQFNLDSLLVVRHGQIIAEAYAPPYAQELPHQMWSASKSVISALYGILLRDGYLDSLDTPVLSFFPDRTFDNMDANKEAMTVRNLLTMASGLQCDMFYPGSPGDAMFLSDDWLQFALSMPMGSVPGTEFHYCNPNVYILSAILTQLTGKSADEFAATTLFAPLGITTHQWESSPQGISAGASGLHLTARDMAKFGYLYLNGGKWEGEQIIPADYVADSLSTQIDPGWPDTSYGYLWWNISSAGTTMALGRGGQYIVLAPDKDLMVVMTGSFNETLRPYLQGYPLNYSVARLTVSDAPLAANPDAQAQLDQQIALISSPPALEMAAQPEIAAAVSGSTFTFMPSLSLPLTGAAGSRSGISTGTVQFDFSNAAQPVLSFTSDEGESWTVPVNMDGSAAVADSPMGLVGTHGEWRADNELCLIMHYVGGGLTVRMDVMFMPSAIEVISTELVGGQANFAVGYPFQQ